eukprot:TRINITY_DN11802_c0_g1_i1.p1 TRINITY_DN11802_c0_g1~~TRINITY_DN11802_c0_g1_i1.p1  ORF type:complete len:135 (+),score=24.31 TRINITY_DN11802_c0_g1_i1:37-441(+)
MYTITSEFAATQKIIKKSRFQATIYPVDTIEEADAEIARVKKKYRKATHNCYAYRIYDENGIIERDSDDMEVPRTAGPPILNAMQSRDVVNALLVVTRYYGGIKLGKGGLVRAYGGTARELFDEVALVEFELDD